MNLSHTNDQQRVKGIIAGSLFLYTLCLFLPGAYSVDSWNQWREVTTKHFDDWYGTGMASTWRLLWIVTGSYASLYVTQMVLYWSFITLLLWRVPLRSFAYWITLGAALFFCFIPQYIMRDSLTVLEWAIAALLLLYAGSNVTHRRKLTILALLLLAHGVWVRINAIVAFWPLAYVVILLLGKRLALWKRLLLTVAVSVVLLVAVQFITYRIQKAERLYPDYKLKLLDLAGISRLSGENYFPAEINHYPAFHLDTLYARYTPASIDDIYWPEDHRPIFPYPNDSLNQAVSKSWAAAIRHHPVYYLENRLTGFLYYLRIKKRYAMVDYWNVAPFFIFPDNPLGLKHENTKLKTRITAAYGHFYRTPIFDPWLWLLLNGVGLGLFIRRYRRRPEKNYWLVHACIQLSGILFLLSQVLIYQHDRDFRYSYWNVIVAFLAVPGLFGVFGAGQKRQGAGVSPAP